LTQIISRSLSETATAHGSDTISVRSDTLSCGSETVTVDIEAETEAISSTTPSPAMVLSDVTNRPHKRRYNAISLATADDGKENPKQKIRKRRQMRYFGDFKQDDIEDPLIRKQYWHVSQRTVAVCRQKIKNLQRKNKRIARKIHTLEALTRHLRKNNLISESAEIALNESFSDSAQALLKRVLKGKKRATYDAQLRAFALTLNFYSKRAYNYVRSTFNKALPHVKTISKWYSTVDASPGYMKEALVALKIKAAEASQENKRIFCSLVFDEMSIYNKIESDGRKTYGYVDLGTGSEADTGEEATEALVFMLVALNSHWKIPVGYFLINKLNASEKANILINCLEFVHNSGVEIVSITFDGCPTNFAVCNVLGANLKDHLDLKTYFPHPITGQNIYIFPDPCHMFKLVRNCFGTLKTIEDRDGRVIDWKFVEKLYYTQETEGLHLANKLRRRHLLWMREKMKVSLAVQTLSKSVADAIDFLNVDLKNPDFADSDATSTFCRIMNNMFDIFNSRNLKNKKEFEKPLSVFTEEKYFQFLEECEVYIKNLKYAGKLIIETQRKVGFMGMLINIKSIQLLYTKLVKEEKLLKFILTYKLSQDHIEIFFSAVRSKGGFNNNPTSRQFQAIMKRLLIHQEISGSENANAVALDNTSILHCSSASPQSNCDSAKRDSEVEISSISDDINLNRNIWHLTLYLEDVTAYIAGFIVKQLKKEVKCMHCLEVLETSDTISKLQVRKRYGVLVNASQYVITVCRVGENVFKEYLKKYGVLRSNLSKIHSIVINQVLQCLPKNTSSCFADHIYDDEPLSNHFIGLTKLILKKYINLRMHHEHAKKSDSHLRIRPKLTKTILFSHQ
ncbi:unnamed protein product, partial [Callosobruchus maculatus]